MFTSAWGGGGGGGTTLPPPSWLQYFTGTLIFAVGLPLSWRVGDSCLFFPCTSMQVSSRLLSWLLPGRIDPKKDFFKNNGGKNHLGLDKNDIFLWKKGNFFEGKSFLERRLPVCSLLWAIWVSWCLWTRRYLWTAEQLFNAKILDTPRDSVINVTDVTDVTLDT